MSCPGSFEENSLRSCAGGANGVDVSPSGFVSGGFRARPSDQFQSQKPLAANGSSKGDLRVNLPPRGQPNSDAWKIQKQNSFPQYLPAETTPAMKHLQRSSTMPNSAPVETRKMKPGEQ